MGGETDAVLSTALYFLQSVFVSERELINNCHFSSPLHSACFKLLCEKKVEGGGVLEEGCVCVCIYYAYVCMSVPASYAKKLAFCQSCQCSHTQTPNFISHPLSTFILHFIPTRFSLLCSTPPLSSLSLLQTLSALSQASQLSGLMHAPLRLVCKFN